MHAFVLAAAVGVFDASFSCPLEYVVWKAEVEAALPVAKEYWIAMGVMEETEHCFESVWSFDKDRREMEWRFAQFDADTPPFADASRLPETTLCRDNWWIGKRYVRFLEEEVRPWLIEGYETALCDALIADTNERLKVWDAISDCRSGWCGREGRRLRLAALRKMVGAEMYYGGNWPEPLPPAGYRSEWKPPDTTED